MYLQRLAQRSIRFTKRQTHDFKLMLGRRTLHGLATGLTTQYSSLYATLLGASPVQLGSLQSAGNAVGALVALPAGWFIDYYSLKNIFLLSTALLAASGLLYFAAPHWTWLYAAIIIYYLGSRITCTACTVTCAGELPNEGRATGRGLCRTLASPVAIAAPLLAAWLISQFGGIRLEGLRPLFAIQAFIFGAILFLLTRLSATHARNGSGDSRRVLSGFVQIFKQGPDVVRLMVIMGLMELPWTIAQPFMPVYAYQFKGADEFVLGGIAMTSMLVPMLASIPLGRLADRHGRKKLLFAIAPLAYAANLLLILAPVSGGGAMLCLLAYGVLFGFNSIGMGLASSMTAEIVPQEQMGRWIGIVGLFRGLLSIPAPAVGGLIWEHIGPQYVFLAAIALDICVRLPLLALTRETLHLRQRIETI
ncbi:MAG: MFS transporter [Anaerolineae bacterium]|nr:MFS transporter [Anaerolineae bacterium]